MAAYSLDTLVSYFDTVRTKQPYSTSLYDFLTGRGLHHQQAQKAAEVQAEIQAGARRSRVKGRKKELPAVTVSARCDGARKAANVTHTGLVCLDFDAVNNPAGALNTLRACPYIAYANYSISGHGLFAIVQVPELQGKAGNEAASLHKQAYKQLSTYFLNHYSLEADKAASDVTRLRLIAPAGCEWINPAPEPFNLETPAGTAAIPTPPPKPFAPSLHHEVLILRLNTKRG
jgi:hypothetical protein